MRGSRKMAGGREKSTGRIEPLPVRAFGLWQDVTEGGEYHVVGAVRRTARAHSGRIAQSVPVVTEEVGFLHSKLQGALRSSVEAIPEADRTFHLVLGIV